LLIYEGSLENAADAYAEPEDQKHPYVSPIYGDYSSGFPPTLIQVGTQEIFLSNAVRHYRALDTAGVPVTIDPYEGMWHVFQAFNWNIPEADLAREKMAVFLKRELDY
jgi:acetyl esterase/lipase